MRPHPFRFGINVFNASSAAEWRAKALKAEALGYSSFVVADHVWVFPPIAGLLAAAEATTTLRIGSYVFGNDFRHPALLAREAAAIDLLSGGRFELGLGSGYHQRDYQQLGLTLESPGVRVGRLEEAVQVIKGLWSGDPFTFSGRYYTLRELQCVPTPTQKPRPPILIGGGGKRALSIAARECESVGLMLRTTPEGGFDLASASPEATAQKIAWIREAAGVRFADLELSILIPFMAFKVSPQLAAEQVTEQFKAHGIRFDPASLRATPHALLGNAGQMTEALEQRREQYGISYVVIREEHMEAFAPVVARLSGT